jgi:hypothetical protein
MSNHLIVSREGGISLDEWLRYVEGSVIVRLVPPRAGINPFTRGPTVFRPPGGAASFNTNGGNCSIEYRDGELHAFSPDDEATCVIQDIAKALNAVMRRGPH